MEDKSKFPEMTFTVFNRYSAIWIWSIIFGGTTGLTYLYISFRTDRMWGELSFIFVVFVLFGSLFLLFTWMSLLKFLYSYIIPNIFKVYKYDQNPDSTESDISIRKAALYLISSLKTLIIATIFRLFLVGLELLLISTGFTSGKGF